MFSTLSAINTLSNNELTVPLVSMTKQDSNDDGLIEMMHLHIEFKGKPQDVKNVKIIGTFDYSLSRYIEMQMIGMMLIDVDTQNGASRIMTDGELNLK